MNLDNNEFLIENGILLDYRSTKEDVVIPEGVTKIEEGAFTCKNINTIKFPSTLKTIASYAFIQTKMPTRLNFPESLENIENDAFDINNNQIIYFNSAVQLHDINPNKYENANIIIGPKGTIEILRYFKSIKSLTLSCHYNVEFALDLRNIPTLHIDCLDATLEEIEKFSNELSIHYLLPQKFVFNSFNFSYDITRILKIAKYIRFENTPPFSNKKEKNSFYFDSQTLKSFNDKLKNITLPKGKYTISTHLFNSSKLTKVILPEGIKEIPFSAFKENDLEELTIPSSIHNIGIQAFERNRNLRVLKILSSNLIISNNAFLDTAIDTVFCSIKAQINVGVDCDCGFDRHIALNIDCQNNSDYLYILKQINNLKKVFKNSSLILYNVPQNWQFIIKMRYPLVKFKEDSNILNSSKAQEIPIDIEDSEIKTKILEINKLIQNLEPQEQNNILSIVTNLVSNFQEQQQSLKPSYRPQTTVLTLNSDLFVNLHMLKTNLLNSLDNIIKNINNKALYLNLLTNLKKYKNELNSKEKLQQSDDKVEEIIRISKEKNLENIKSQLITLLDDTSKKLTNYLLNGLNNSSEFSLKLTDEDYLKSFEQQIAKLYTIASNKEIILNAFKGIGDNTLAKDINIIYEIINLLNIKFQDKMKQKLNKVLDNINEEEYLKDYEQLELIIRSFLQDFLLELKEKGSNLTAIQNIIDDINNINKPNYSNNTLVIRELINEIIGNCPPEIVNEVKKEIEEVIKKWENIITNHEYQINNQEYGNLNEATVLTLQILENLYEIKFNIEKYQIDMNNFNCWKSHI